MNLSGVLCLECTEVENTAVIVCQFLCSEFLLFKKKKKKIENDVPFSFKNLFLQLVCLFELMLADLINSYGHVGMLPPFYGIFIQNFV